MVETWPTEPRSLRYTGKPKTHSPDVPWSVWMSQAARFSQSQVAAGEDSAFLHPEDATAEPECEAKRPHSAPPAKQDHQKAAQAPLLRRREHMGPGASEQRHLPGGGTVMSGVDPVPAGNACSDVRHRHYQSHRRKLRRGDGMSAKQTDISNRGQQAAVTPHQPSRRRWGGCHGCSYFTEEEPEVPTLRSVHLGSPSPHTHPPAGSHLSGALWLRLWVQPKNRP